MALPIRSGVILYPRGLRVKASRTWCGDIAMMMATWPRAASAFDKGGMDVSDARTELDQYGREGSRSTARILKPPSRTGRTALLSALCLAAAAAGAVSPAGGQASQPSAAEHRWRSAASPAAGLWRGVTADTMEWYKAVEEE